MSRRLKDRMCQWGSCRNEFDWCWCGLGAKKFCNEHMEIARKTREKIWYQNNKEYVKAKNLKNYHDNKEARQKKSTEYYFKHQDKLKAYMKKYREDHKEELFLKRQEKLRLKRLAKE
jgi:CHAT domain-containing protein